MPVAKRHHWFSNSPQGVGHPIDTTNQHLPLPSAVGEEAYLIPAGFVGWINFILNLKASMKSKETTEKENRENGKKCCRLTQQIWWMNLNWLASFSQSLQSRFLALLLLLAQFFLLFPSSVVKVSHYTHRGDRWYNCLWASGTHF